MCLVFSQKLILKICRCYNVVCSGVNQALCAIFLAYSKKKFGRKLSLLRGSGNRMASFFYAMARLLRLKDVLITTVHSPEFAM